MAQARNTIKFKSVRSDASYLEGTLRCSDDQWAAVFAILMGKVSPADVIKAAQGHCTNGDLCACGGDLPAIREGCANWKKPAALNQGNAS